MSETIMTIEELQYFSDNGDANATRLITEIRRYQTAKAQELNTEIRTKFIGGITQQCAIPTAVTDRDGKVPQEIIRLANEWLELVQPDEEHIYE